MLEFYVGFEINDLTGEPMTDKEMTDIHYRRIRSRWHIAQSFY